MKHQEKQAPISEAQKEGSAITNLIINHLKTLMFGIHLLPGKCLTREFLKIQTTPTTITSDPGITSLLKREKVKTPMARNNFFMRDIQMEMVLTPI